MGRCLGRLYLVAVLAMWAGGEARCVEVEVLPLTDSVEPAEKTAEPSVNARIQAFVASIDKRKSYVYLSAGTRKILLQNRKLALTLLSDSLKRHETSHPKYALQVAKALVEIGEKGAAESLWKGLASDDAAIVLVALRSLTSLDRSPADAKPHITLDAEQRAQLLKMLEHHEVKVRKQAVEACGRHEVAEAREPFLRMLPKAHPSYQGRIAFWLGRLFPSLDTVRALTEVDPKKRAPADYWLIQGYGQLLKAKDDAVAKAARDALPAFASSVPARMRYDQGFVRELLKPAATKAMLPLLEDIVANAKDPIARGGALEAIARIQGAGAADLLLGHLKTRQLRRSVFAGLKHAITDANRESVWKRLAAEYGSMKKDATLRRYELEFLLRFFRPESRGVLAKTYVRLQKSTKMWLVWELRGLKLAEVLRAFHAGGVLSQPTDADMLRIDKRVSEYGDTAESDRLYAALSEMGVLASFDAESDEIPCRHDRLIRSTFADASGGKFRPTHVRQIWHQKNKNDRTAPYTVEFTFGKHRYRFPAENMGDWYDLKAVLTGVNAALKHEGLAERFVALEPNGQFAAFLFTDPKRLAPLAQKYHIPLQSDPDHARKLGLDFEREVLETLKAE